MTEISLKLPLLPARWNQRVSSGRRAVSDAGACLRLRLKGVRRAWEDLPMIKNASELLAAFIAKERAEEEKFSMPHMPTLGEAYEGIARDGIDQEFVLPPNLDLRVVSGFIEGLPHQIDCMLVRGDGVPYSRSGKHYYKAAQVLCVMEVKKTLNKAALVDGINHLAEIQKHCLADFDRRYESDEVFDFSQAQCSYERLTGRIAPRSAKQIDSLPDHERLLFGILARHAFVPVTVLLGFDGYATENGLRTAMVDVVEDNTGANSVASPDLLPSLITAGRFSLLKCTGQPYLLAGPKGWLVVQASARHNIARILLEFLWTKISVFCKVRMPFGQDLDYENIKELLLVQSMTHNGQQGFKVRAEEMSEKALQRTEVKIWKPAKISPAAVDLAQRLAFFGGQLDLGDALKSHLRKEYQVALDDAVQELIATYAYCRSEETLQIIGDEAYVTILDDDSGYADIDLGRLQTWCEQQGLKGGFISVIRVA